MLKNLSLIALLGFVVVGVPSELSAKSVKVAGILKGVAAKSVTRQVAQQNVTIEFYSPSIVRILKSDAGVGAPVQKKSYSVILKPQQMKGVQIQENGDIVKINSSFISVELNQQTGEILFLSKDGKLLLTDTKTRLEARKDEANKGKYRIEQDFRLADDEAIYGLGQLRDVYMNLRGRQNIELWNHNTYIAIPYFTSEKGYGLYWDNAGKTYFNDIVASRNNSNQPSCTSFTSEVGTCADYYFMYKDGTQDGVIASIRELTGQATMFPKWAMGFWQCRERYKTSDELAGVLDKYRELKIPTDAIVQDWQYWGCDSNWNAMKFQNPYYINKVGDPAYAKYLPTDMKQVKAQGEPRLKSPEEMVKYVHKNDAHLMISIWASFGPWTEQYRELKKMNALLPFDTWPRNSGVMPYDVFNPKARNLYWKYLTHLYQMGFDAWWTDSSEPDHIEKPGDWAYDAMIKTIKLRYRLLPYIYSTAGDCVQNSGSMMRALVMDYATDKKASRLNDEYLFGRNILVKPVTDPLYTWKDKEKKGHTIYPDVRKAAAPVNVYLPKGNKWYDFWSNTQYEGGQDIQRLCPIDIMPVFIKAGTILPFGPEVQYSSEKPWDELEIRVYPGADGKFTLYEDEGDNYNYEKGKFSEIQFVWDEADRTLNIDSRKGSYKGMLQHRRFHIVLVGTDSGTGDEPMQASKSVEYDGKAVKVQL
ncbi:TIM-barrel domain-containing protein [Prevotellaceae bacterium LCP21S3_C11]